MKREPEVKKINLYKPDELCKLFLNKNRLARVVLFPNEMRYCDWHSFTKMRNQFLAKFGHRMPGVADIYEKQVRVEFNFNKFFNAATTGQLYWVTWRLLPDFIPPPRQTASPSRIQ